MNCVLPGNNVKVLAKTVLALNRISDEIFIECTEDQMKFSAMNAAHTSYALYNFTSLFFLTYTVDLDSQQSQPERSISCKVYAQGLLNIFKSHSEKDVDSCKITVENNADDMVFVIKCRDEVSIMYRRHLLTFDSLKFQYDSEKMQNTVEASAGLFADMLGNFQMRDLNLYMDVEDDKVAFRNFGVANTIKGLRSTMTLASAEFLQYRIKRKSNCVMSLKTFKSAVVFGAFFNLNMSLHFTCGGKPLIVKMQSATFNVDYVLATVDPDSSDSTQSSATLENALNEEDQSVLQNIDWDDQNDVQMLSQAVSQNQNSSSLSEDYRFSITNNSVLMNVFRRCYEPQMDKESNVLGEILAENSDSDNDL